MLSPGFPLPGFPLSSFLMKLFILYDGGDSFMNLMMMIAQTNEFYDDDGTTSMN